MAKILTRLFPLLLLGLLLTPLLSFTFVSADDDVTEEVAEQDDDDDLSVSVEEEEDGRDETVTMRGGDDDDEPTKSSNVQDSEEEEEEEEEYMIGPSTDVKTMLLFTKKDKDSIVAGEVVDTLIGFTNNGKQNFIVTGIEASLRYPQDFSYHIQNFSMLSYERYIEPNTEASFAYSFIPSDTLFARPFGLVLNIYYKDEENTEYRDSVFNNTINIIEIEEGFDPETFFMYIFMISGLCLLMFIVHYVYTTVRRGGRTVTKKQTPVETGTQRKLKNGVDYDWLPENHLGKPSPRKSPRNQSSPRNKKSKPLTTPNVD